MVLVAQVFALTRIFSVAASTRALVRGRRYQAGLSVPGPRQGERETARTRRRRSYGMRNTGSIPCGG
jgi:hypothetical protein